MAKISVALLRHTNVLPADRAFYQAGLQCKVRAYGRVRVCVVSEGREFYARVVKFLCTRDKVRFYARALRSIIMSVFFSSKWDGRTWRLCFLTASWISVRYVSVDSMHW